ncbi:MAG: SIS domain-containing protein [Clostridia bacterium]|nr:SIS domain-containing protein [Clostridia bacterium]
MSGKSNRVDYMDRATDVLQRIHNTQRDTIMKASELMARAIASGGLVHVFGSGHSVIPVLDIFPRYGSFVGVHPLMDPRLMWFNVIGPGGAPELLWIERREGYVANFLKSFEFRAGDVMLVYSHGGVNAAPVEAALYAKDRGLSVVAVTSGDNQRSARAIHSSGHKLGDIADVMIDNCVPLEDALVRIEGQIEPVGAGSTLAAVAITMSLLSETARKLVERGHKLSVFVSPNVAEAPPNHNEQVFSDYQKSLLR